MSFVFGDENSWEHRVRKVNNAIHKLEKELLVAAVVNPESHRQLFQYMSLLRQLRTKAEENQHYQPAWAWNEHIEYAEEILGL